MTRKFAFNPYQWQIYGDPRWNIDSWDKRVVYRMIEGLSNFLHELGKSEPSEIQAHLKQLFDSGFFKSERCRRNYQNALMYLDLVQEKQKRLLQT